MTTIKVMTDLELSGLLSFDKNYTDFPVNPAPRAMSFVNGVFYIYAEITPNSGFFTWQPIGEKRASYLHTQGVASSTWTVNHNFGTNDFAYFVYDQDHNMVIANNHIVNNNQVQILLSSAMTGTVVMFALQYLNSTSLAVAKQIDIGNLVLTDDGSGFLCVNGSHLATQTQLDLKADLSLVTTLLNNEIDTGSLTTDFSVQNLNISGNILPSQIGISSLGSPTHKFGSIYTKELFLDANTLYIAGVPVMASNSSTIQITADNNQGIGISTTGYGQTILNSQAETLIQTNGVNADVAIQTVGIGSMVKMTSANGVIITTPTLSVVGNETISGNLIIAGNITVNGAMSYVETTNLAIKDNVIVLNDGELGSGVSLHVAGISINRGDLAMQRLIWSETLQNWAFGQTGSELGIATQAYVTSAIAALPSLVSVSSVTTGLANEITRAQTVEATLATQSAVTGSLALKADLTYVTAQVATLAPQASTYTKTQVDTAIANVNHNFSSLIGLPTTLVGYGITDAVTSTASTAAILVETNARIAADYTLTSNLASEASTARAAEALKAPLLSPALTGTPTAPTATVGTNTTQLATTAFVLANGVSSTSISDDITTNTTNYLHFGSATTGIMSTVTTSSTKLQYNPSTGTVSATNFSSLSDATLKGNVQDITNSSEILEKIRPVSFTWNDNGAKSYGVIAQELESILPELVHTNSEGIKSVEYSALIGFLISSNKELLESNKALSARLDALEQK
jgi:Chaperone of endosialidase